MQRKLDKGEYKSPAEYAADVNLVWNNCTTYNRVRLRAAFATARVCSQAALACSGQDDSDYYAMAVRMRKLFQTKFAKITWEGKGAVVEAQYDAVSPPGLPLSSLVLLIVALSCLQGTHNRSEEGICTKRVSDY